MPEIHGYDSQDDFDAAVAKWNAEHADEPSRMLADAARLQRRDRIVAATLEDLAHAVKVAGLSSLAWSIDAPYECADSVTAARTEYHDNIERYRLDATVAAELILTSLRQLEEEWPMT